MTNITINDASLALLSSGEVAGDDVIPIWDTSAAVMKRTTRAAVVGADIIGGGTINANGKVATIPANGTAAIREVANVFGGLATVPAIMSGGTGSLTDDTAISFTPSSTTGLLIIWSITGGGATNGMRAAIMAYRATATPYCYLIAQPGTVMDVGTVALTGATGVDNKITVAAAADGKIYVENRVGSTGAWAYLLLGNS